MDEPIIPLLRKCLNCHSEGTIERAYNYFNTTIAYVRVQCSKCGKSGFWIEYTYGDLASMQEAVNKASHWWNTYQPNEDDDDEY